MFTAQEARDNKVTNVKSILEFVFQEIKKSSLHQSHRDFYFTHVACARNEVVPCPKVTKSQLKKIVDTLTSCGYITLVTECRDPNETFLAPRYACVVKRVTVTWDE